MELRFILILFAIAVMIFSIANFPKYYYNNNNSNENNHTEEVNITDIIKEEDNLTSRVEEEEQIITDKIDINTDKSDISTIINTDKSDISPDISDINTDIYDDLKDTNYFIATYRSQKGKKVKAFNPLAVQINDSQYFLTYFEDTKESNSENIRSLEEDELEILEMNITNSSEGYFDSPKDGFIKIKVYFLDPLASLDFLFYNCID